VVVVNHHLFFADVMLRDSGVAELLPACNTVIFDEAHQLPETASLFFGESVSTAQLLELARDARMEGVAAAKDFLDLPDGARALEKAARDLRLAIPGENARFSAAQLPPAFYEALEQAADELGRFGKLLESQAERSEGLEHCWRRAQELSLTLQRWRQTEEPGLVRWAEVFSQALSLNATPLVIADIFRKQMEGHPRAWIFTSATLAVERDFSHYCAELGLTRESRRHRLLGQPLRLSEPGAALCAAGPCPTRTAGYNEAVVEAAWPLIHASRGRAFVLCTSLRAMRRIHELLKQRFEAAGFDHPLLLQGEGSKSELLARFRRLGNAVLVASQSFWEGVDVRGEALVSW
jgi:ATP-dependent DNA helicase DinG